MKRKVVQKLMCAMLASSMLMTGFGVEAFASEDKNQQELSTEAPVTDEKVTYTIACQLSPNWEIRQKANSGSGWRRKPTFTSNG